MTESARSGQPIDEATMSEAIAMVSGGLGIEGQAGKAALAGRLARGAQGADQSGIASKLIQGSGSALTKDAGRAATDAADAAAGRIPTGGDVALADRFKVEVGKTRSLIRDTVTGKTEPNIFTDPAQAEARAASLNAQAKPYDANAVTVTAAAKSVPSPITDDIRRALRDPELAPNVTAEFVAKNAQKDLDAALISRKAPVTDANRLSLAQQVIDAQVVRNKIIVAKGYRNVPELPPDAPVMQEALRQPDGGAEVFDRTRQVLDEANSFDNMVGDAGRPPEGPRLTATGGPNEPPLPPEIPGSPRSFGPRQLGQLASEVMYNGIVFPTTNLVHSMGSTLSALSSFPEHILLSGVDKTLRTVGITKGRNFTAEASLAGLNAQLHGMGNSIAHDLVPNIIHGSESLVDRDLPHEVSTSILRGEYGSNPLLKVLGAVGKVASEGNYPLRTIAAIDDTIRRGLSASALMERGIVKGTNEGLTGPALHEYAAKFVNEAGPEDLLAAENAAKTQINRQAPGDIGSRILDIKGSMGPVGTVLLPFFNTKLNILRAATTWSPLGFGRLLPKNTPVLGYFARNTITEADRVQALTRATTGTLLMVPIWQQVLADNITGDGPIDPREKTQWTGDPKQPSHIERALRTPFGWVTYGKVPVIGDYIAAIADAAQAVRENKAADVSGAQAAMGGLIQYFGKEEQGISDAISTLAAVAEAWKNPNNMQAQAALAQELASRGFEITPFSGLIRAEAAVAGDPYKRLPPGTKGLLNRTLEGYRAQLPGFNADMPNGSPRVPGISSGVGSLMPIRTAPEGAPVNGTAAGLPPTATAEAARIAATVKDFKGLNLPTNKLGVGKPYELTLSGNQYLDFSQAVGAARNDAINKLLLTPSYQKAPDGIKARLYTLAVQSADRIGEQNYLKNGVLTSKDPEQTQQDALLLMSQGTLADRAKWAGLMAQSGKLTAETRSAIDAARPAPLPGQKQMPTMAEYISAAPHVSEYLAIPPYLQGNQQEWDQLKITRAKLANAETEVRKTGQYLPPTALHYQALSMLTPAEQALINKYPTALVNPARRIFLMAHPEVGRFVQ